MVIFQHADLCRDLMLPVLTVLCIVRVCMLSCAATALRGTARRVMHPLLWAHC